MIESRVVEQTMDQFNSNPLMVLKLSADGKTILDANQAACDFYGYSLFQFKDMPLEQLQLKDELHAAVDSQYQIHRMASGKLQQVWIQKLALPDSMEDLTLCLIQSFPNDNKIATAMLESRSLYRSLVNSLPICVYRIDLKGRLTFVNKELQKLMQLEKDDLLGKTAYDFYPQELACKYRRDDARVVSSGIMFREIEENINPSTGEESYVEVIKVPVWDKQGSVIGLQGAFWDVSNRIKYEQQLKQAAAVFTHAKEAVLIVNQYGRISDTNNAFTNITGYRREQVLNRFPRHIIHSDHLRDQYREITNHVRKKGFWHGELELVHRESLDIISVQCSVSSVEEDASELQSYVILLTDISKQKRYQKQLEHIALYDPLTKLPNRLLLSQKLREAMEQAEQTQNRIAVLYIDLDGFKEVNDRHGHQVGDRLLIDIANNMTSILDERDTVARLGGDEFVVVVPCFDERSNQEQYLKSLLSAISQPVHSSAGVIEVSGSLGMTFYPQAEQVGADHLIRQADVAMYQAKVQGKNRYAVFDVRKEKLQKTSQQTLAQLKVALEQEQLLMYYQPKVNMVSGEVIGVESLLRWQHPSLGLLTPESFLPAALENSTIVDIDHWVVETVIAQAEKWRQQGLEFQLSINLSVRTLEVPDFSLWLGTLLKRYPKVKPSNIILEVLESSAVEDVDQISLVIRATKQLGVTFSLDDFGMGYSTLNLLKKLPADELKIDRSFVRDMLNDEDDLAIIKGILGLAAAFNKKVIAEGVESEEHGLALLEVGCQQAQGFVIAKPMAADELLHWVRGWTPFTSWKKQPALS